MNDRISILFEIKKLKDDLTSAGLASEEELKIKMGKPDKVNFKNGNRNRFYIYKSEKFKIKCERIFEIDSNDKVIGFSSKNCF